MHAYNVVLSIVNIVGDHLESSDIQKGIQDKKNAYSIALKKKKELQNGVIIKPKIYKDQRVIIEVEEYEESGEFLCASEV